jgi:hypothetical protein
MPAKQGARGPRRPLGPRPSARPPALGGPAPAVAPAPAPLLPLSSLLFALWVPLQFMIYLVCCLRSPFALGSLWSLESI